MLDIGLDDFLTQNHTDHVWMVSILLVLDIGLDVGRHHVGWCVFRHVSILLVLDIGLDECTRL